MGRVGDQARRMSRLLTNSSNRPSSRPNPERFTPPNGSPETSPWAMLMVTIPVFSRSARDFDAPLDDFTWHRTVEIKPAAYSARCCQQSIRFAEVESAIVGLVVHSATVASLPVYVQHQLH